MPAGDTESPLGDYVMTPEEEAAAIAEGLLDPAEVEPRRPRLSRPPPRWHRSADA